MLQIGSVLRKNIQYDKIHYIRDGQHWYNMAIFVPDTNNYSKWLCKIYLLKYENKINQTFITGSHYKSLRF